MDRYDDDTVKLEIFKLPTTYQSDYKPYCTYKRQIYKNRGERGERPKQIKPAPPIDDPESFAKWKDDVHIPFDLLLVPKPIIGTNPYKPFQKLAPIEEVHKDELIKTTPRVYMTPAASMDDIDDPEMRELICNYMYTTDWRHAEREATAGFKKHEMKLLNCKKPTVSDPVKLQVDLYKPIAESFQRTGKEWDTPQLRSMVDTTREFWIHKDPPVLCGACVNPFKDIVPSETKETISSLIANDKLRLAHDSPPPSYAGYRMRLAKGVPLSKVELPTAHPFLSTSQAITARYAEDLKK